MNSDPVLDRAPDPEPPSDPTIDPELELALRADFDFAEEHRDLTVGDAERGGPEGIPENESPRGYGGADIHRPSRRHR